MSFQDILGGANRCTSTMPASPPRCGIPIEAARPSLCRFVAPTTKATTVCLVDQDEDVLTTTTVGESTSWTNAAVDNDIPKPVPRRNNKKAVSAFSKINDQVVHFQKMVVELESLLEASAVSPEHQWRARILLRSATEADKAIGQALYESETDQDDGHSRAQWARQKLVRDFERIHTQWMDVVEAYTTRQQVQVSFLSATEETKEDFFDRAMREREDQVDSIHKSMHKVNEIYTDLAKLVNDQQELVDSVETTVESSKATTQAGASHIHRAAMGWCGSTQNVWDDNKTPVLPLEEDVVDDDDEDGFHWSMPFLAIRDDVQAAHENVVLLVRKHKKLFDCSKPVNNVGESTEPLILSISVNEEKSQS